MKVDIDSIDLIYHVMSRLDFFNKVIAAFFALFLYSPLQAQSVDINLSATMLKNYNIWEKGKSINIRKFVHETSNDALGNLCETFYLSDDQGNNVNINSKVNTCFDFQYHTTQQLWDACIVSNVLHSLVKYGYKYDLRYEMENDALRYIQTIKEYNLELNDPYLETYIYSLIAKIAPAYLVDGRPSSINLLIQQNPDINACCYPNGTIVLNTGLLAALHSEAELVAILSHEIAHFVLDHSVQNVLAETNRAKWAEFWASLATGLTAVAEGYITANNEYYVPGAATYSMATLSTSIAVKIIERLGMKYNHDQESEADKYAIEVLKILGYDENALASALSRLEDEYIRERNSALYITSYTHPALVKRIDDAGTPSKTEETAFEQIISFAVSNVAMMKYSDRRFHQCLPYVCQNIDNKVATSDDYLLKARCLLSTRGDSDSNNEVISLIDKAKQVDGNNINIYKAEIIAYLRLNDRIKAIELLNNYIAKLDSYNLTDIKSDKYWESMMDFVNVEKRWASQMRVKLSGI